MKTYKAVVDEYQAALTAREALNIPAIKFRLRNKMFSKTFSAEIVGGRSKLDRLIKSGKIRTTQKNNPQGNKYSCFAFDVLMYAASPTLTDFCK